MFYSFECETCKDWSNITAIGRKLEDTSQQSTDGAERPRKHFADHVNGAANHASGIIVRFGCRCFRFRLNDLIRWLFPGLGADSFRVG
jgi:hypothetical protein